MNGDERVSIIIPTYNRAHTIERALESCFNQTRVPDEIIVVDDGSTDNTLQILEKYADRITIVSDGNNYGQAIARNRGLEIVTGKFVAFLDSDDTLPINSIELRLNALFANSDYDVVYADTNIINETTGKVIMKYSDFRPHNYKSGNVYFEYLKHNLATIHSYMFRMSHRTKEIRMNSDVQWVEDYEFWLQLSKVTPFLYLDAIVANYHFHEDMGSITENDKQRHGYVRVQRKHLDDEKFHTLTATQKAQIYTKVGMSIAVVEGDMRDARYLLRKAIQQQPTKWLAYIYWLMTWLGANGLNVINSLRRKIRSQGKNALPIVVNSKANY